MDVWRDGSLGAVLVFILSHVCLYCFFHYSSVLSLRVLGSVTSLSFLALYLCSKEKQRTELEALIKEGTGKDGTSRAEHINWVVAEIKKAVGA